MSANVFPEKLWLETPLIYSSHISSKLGCSAYLKLENLQPSQSFKFRGLSHFAQHAKAQHGPSVHLLAASGGNAGVAVALAAHALGVRCTIYLPEGVGREIHDILKMHGANVIAAGKRYSEALQKLLEDMKKDSSAVLVPAYDDPLVWEGHSSMITEIKTQLAKKPDAIFCSVGGGGLLGGVIQGCKQTGWEDVPVVALGTHGANCFYHSVSLNTWNSTSASTDPVDIVAVAENAPYDVVLDPEHDVTITHLRELTSRASSLAATSPSAGVVKLAIERPGGVKCVCVPDEMSMWAARTFAEDHKFLVELACSTTLTAAYNCDLFSHLVTDAPTTVSGASSSELNKAKREKTVVFIVCGGIKVSLDEMTEYRTLEAAIEADREWEVACNGERIRVKK
ncbi:hypothetical protein SERLA73DRAFT_175550 [Serpula lacrymans var. lacrymans S7.3]|uniref:L-serine ammonia-lyase n=2 Tax=Serpula lacrymans var. lacrymans TaxID=341189 RepID=F8PKF2_SERL3|nr:uncharacterized protein SERLADRAFT_458063 [Serpula lacrymans var. lacrymans S7.9]EGO03866.1 hypothetical protein SERLA73DRAFT_175550 [Serpula lacrymans var. lacrymans S7.3]EGO29793.1 hypothetical protein SERLADRAFT_458063 [Serpula lacrymans var. lacrymans S7.9]